MTEPRNLTEEMPETTEDLSNRGLILDSAGQAQPGSNKRLLTEDLPQEEDEGAGNSELLTED